MHPLQRRRTLRHDRRAGPALADKGDRFDIGMFGQRFACLLAEAVHEVPDTRRQAGLLGDFHQDARSDRREFRRLMDDRAAGREGRGDLPGRQHEGRVPGRDHADGADRHAGRDVHQRRGRQHLTVPRGRGTVRKKTEILGTAKGGLGHEAKGLACIEALAKGNFLGTLDDGVGDLVKNCFALGSREVPPGGKG